MLRTSIFHANERALFYDEYRIAYRRLLSTEALFTTNATPCIRKCHTFPFKNVYFSLSRCCWAGQKDRLVVSKLFLWYGGDFGSDDRAVMEWIASNMPTDTQVPKDICLKFLIHFPPGGRGSYPYSEILHNNTRTLQPHARCLPSYISTSYEKSIF